MTHRHRGRHSLHWHVVAAERRELHQTVWEHANRRDGAAHGHVQQVIAAGVRHHKITRHGHDRVGVTVDGTAIRIGRRFVGRHVHDVGPAAITRQGCQLPKIDTARAKRAVRIANRRVRPQADDGINVATGVDSHVGRADRGETASGRITQ